MPNETADATLEARTRVRQLLAVEGDLAFRRRCETIIEWLAAEPGDVILDCGSGYGFVLRVLLELTPSEVVGLEYQRERIDAACGFLGHHDRLTLVQGDAMALPFPDDTFDHIVCSEVLEHLERDDVATRELFRVLKPSGTLVVTVPSHDFPFTWDPPNWVLKRFGRSMRGERPWSGIWYGHRRLYTTRSLKALVTEAGFTIEAYRGLTHHTPPFAHLLLYGIGKPLLQSGLVPARLRRQVDRQGDAGSPRGLAGGVMRILERVDAPNDAPDLEDRVSTFVALAVRCRKPFP